jgi:serine/threonine protein kinase
VPSPGGGRKPCCPAICRCESSGSVSSLAVEFEVEHAEWKIEEDELVMSDACLVGEGATGRVYRARFQSSDVAVKVVRGAEDGGLQARQQMKALSQEIKASCALAGKLADQYHPNVVQFLGATSDSTSQASVDSIKVVYEFIHGQDLEGLYRAARQTNSQPTLLQVAEWSVQLFSALSFLHTQEPPMVHRDVKPSNIMIVSDSQLLKLVDLGLTRCELAFIRACVHRACARSFSP